MKVTWGQCWDDGGLNERMVHRIRQEKGQVRKERVRQEKSSVRQEKSRIRR